MILYISLHVVCVILLFFLIYKLLNQFNYMYTLIKKIILLNIWLDFNLYKN